MEENNYFLKYLKYLICNDLRQIPYQQFTFVLPYFQKMSCADLHNLVILRQYPNALK